jgi:TRAP-type C4-dicarboxylate transport system permease small subunit
MTSPVKTIEGADAFRAFDLASVVLAGAACIVLFAMMFFVFADVIGRYFFLSPLPAAYEVVSLMMPVLIFCALPLTVLRQGHVTVDLLDSLIPSAVARVQQVLVNLFSCVALGLMAWRLAIRGWDQRRFDEVTDELFLELWPFSAGMAALATVAALACLVNVWRAAAGRLPRG